MQYFTGTSGWTYDHWKGTFYPAGLPRSKWFSWYSSQFKTVEINATFYRTFQESTFKKWYQVAPPGFLYVLKAPRLITHRRFLKDCDDLIRDFAFKAELLGEKLGLILLQLAPSTPYDPELLGHALRQFPDPSKVAVEFRHKRWDTPEVFTLLQSLHATLVNVDSPATRAGDRLTSGTAYLRLHGRVHWYSYDYSRAELQEIALILQHMESSGATRAFVFFNNDFEAHAPANALQLMQLIRLYHEA